MKTYKNWIGGQWIDSRTKRTFLDRSPADRRDVIGEFARSGPKDIDHAVAWAQKALDQWKAVPAPKRAGILFKCAQILYDRKENFAISWRTLMQNGQVLKW